MGLRDLLGSALTFGLSGAYKPTANPNLGFDPQGNPIDAKSGKALSATDLQNPQYAPYTDPSIMARMFSPEAQQIAALNAQAEAGGNLQGRQAALTRQIGEQQNINPLMSQLIGAGLPPNANAIYAMTGGNPTSPEQMTELGRGYRNLVGGLPSTLSQTDLTTAGTALKGAQFEQQQQPTAQTAERAEMLNRLASDTKLTPLQIQDTVMQAQGQLGREPTEQEILLQSQKVRGIEAGGAVQRAPIEQSSALAGSLAGNINAWNPTPEQFPFTQSPFRAHLSLDQGQPNVNFNQDQSSFLPAMYNKLYAAQALGRGLPGQRAIIDPDTGKPVYLPSQQPQASARGLVGSPAQQPSYSAPAPQMTNPSGMRAPVPQQLPSGPGYVGQRTLMGTPPWMSSISNWINQNAPYLNQANNAGQIKKALIGGLNWFGGNTQ